MAGRVTRMAFGLFTTLVVVLGAVATPACRLSEYFCDNGRCVPLNRYCDAVNDCGDSSDEPRFCTPCNRTYFGDVGKTYEMELHRPKEDRLPFICHLTFTAAGGAEMGDLVQLTFDSFTMGRFVSFTTDGCPDGSLQIVETDRPRVGGSWCGTSWGSAIYYSETRTLTLTLRLLKLSRDQTGYNFDFRMGYKMLPKDTAVVRYGGAVPEILKGVPYQNTSAPSASPSPYQTESPAAVKYYLGDLIAGTYCSRIFSDCDQKVCRLQSPNFPGVYPRNLTCYYAVRQHEVPPGKHALIVVRQPKGQLVAIRSQSALYGSATNQQHHNRELKVWSQCDDVQDYVTVYDGYTTRDPALLKFCGAGEAVPETVSSGPELLVEFTTSPYGTFLYPAPLHALHGFQLEVEVRFVDIQSPTYSRNKRCEFWIRGNDKGTLDTPQHSLPPNTTCLYHMQGVDPSAPPPPLRYPDVFTWRRGGQVFSSSRYRVWMSVLKFHVTSTIDPKIQEEEQCASHLKVWDGAVKPAGQCNDIFCEQEVERSRLSMLSSSSHGGSSGKHPLNATLLARYCKDQVPRSCDHSLLSNGTRVPRPCSLAESFLSTGDSITLELKLAESSALRPVSFRALYEFVDLHQDGEPFGTGPCSRKFISRSQGQLTDAPQKFRSPRNVFLFGRGGNTNLSCTYRFEAQKGERVKLTLNKLQTQGRQCLTQRQADIGRIQCHDNSSATLRVFEVPWADTPALARDCLCSGAGVNMPYVFISTAQVVEVRFQVTNMNASDDFLKLNFEGTWEFVRTPLCKRKQRLGGPSGEITFRYPSRTPEEINCESHPWLIEPASGRYLYVKLSGIFLQQIMTVDGNVSTINSTSTLQLPRASCETLNRIAVHSGGSVHVVICPQPPSAQRHHMVEIFSEGWVISSTKLVHQPVLSLVTNPEQRAVAQSRNVIVEFVAHEPGSYTVTWLELSRRRSVLPPEGFVMEDCPHRCPELDACINASLWCDGTAHCPSGYDEAAKHCSFILQLPLLYLGLGVGGLLAISCSLCIVAFRACKRRSRSGSQHRLKSISQDTSTLGSKEVIC